MDNRSNPNLDTPHTPRQRLMLTLAYNGAPFNGWQIQPNRPSVQQTIEDALRTILRIPLHIVGAGRTDTAVNARYMTAHLDLPANHIDPTPDKLAQLQYRLNAILHPNIAIYSITPISTDIHARFDARTRTYRYYLHTVPDPFRHQQSLYMHRAPDIALMNDETQALLGTHDFTSFSKLHTDTKTNICTITNAHWTTYSPGHHYFEITADRFLRNMVRAIVGTHLEVGTHRQQPGHTAHVIEAKNRAAAGTSAPGHALYLWNITYPIDLPRPILPDNL